MSHRPTASGLDQHDSDVDVLTRTQTKPKRPSLYKVVLKNDDYTPMDFVVYILERFFNKSTEEAVQIMLAVHNQGSAICGIYTFEVAEAKMTQVLSCAHHHGHPLQCVLEKE